MRFYRYLNCLSNVAKLCFRVSMLKCEKSTPSLNLSESERPSWHVESESHAQPVSVLGETIHICPLIAFSKGWVVIGTRPFIDGDFS